MRGLWPEKTSDESDRSGVPLLVNAPQIPETSDRACQSVQYGEHPVSSQIDNGIAGHAGEIGCKTWANLALMSP
jgi:hypothetical protein